MPSFLTDDSNVFSNNPDILNLDPTNQFGLATTKERVNGGSIRHNRSDTINESFDDSSISSTHASDVSDTTPVPMNGNGTRPTSMSSLSNGRTVSGGFPVRELDDAFREKPLPNGTTTLVDRTVPRPSTNDVNGVESTMNRSNLQHDDPYSKPLPAEPPVEESREKAPKQSFDAAPRISNVSSTTEKQTQTPFLSGPPTPDPTQSIQRTLPSGHRLSSPPIYQSGNTTASSSNHLQTPQVPGVLKQRHTLDVPKLPPGRLSKDGMDTAQASGRFSPTSAPPTERPRRASLSLARRNTRSMQSDFPRDEVVPDEDAARWAEMYRQKRASKRKRKEEEDDDRVLVGTKVDETHANWVTAYNMLTGIRVSVSRTNAKLDRELTDADFETKQKSTFDM